MAIVLVPPKADFAEEFLNWRNDPITVAFNPLQPSTLDSLRERLEKAQTDLSKLDASSEYLWFIREDQSPKNLGQVSVQRINLQMMTAEIGYTISPNARGRSIGTQAVQHLTKMVFEKTNIRKLIALVHVDNTPSRRILEKVGYKEEGLLREHFLVNGHPVDEVIYGILRRDFDGASKPHFVY